MDLNATTRLIEEHWFWFPLLSIPIYLCFVLCGRSKTSGALLISASVPGMFIPAYFGLGIASIFRDPSATLGALTRGMIFFSIICPGLFVFPIVFLIQSIKLVAGDTRRISIETWVYVFALALLYLWSDHVFINADNFLK